MNFTKHLLVIAAAGVFSAAVVAQNYTPTMGTDNSANQNATSTMDSTGSTGGTNGYGGSGYGNSDFGNNGYNANNHGVNNSANHQHKAKHSHHGKSTYGTDMNNRSGSSTNQ